MKEVKTFATTSYFETGFHIQDDDGVLLASAKRHIDNGLWYTIVGRGAPYTYQTERQAREYIFAELVKQRMTK